MKANEILSESTDSLQEAPVGGISRLFTNIGAKLGLSGSQIQKQVNDEMMQVKRELQPIVRSGGGQISVQEMISFLNGKGYGANADKIIKLVKSKNKSKSSAPLTSQEIDKVVEQAVVRGYAQKGGMGVGKYGSKPGKGAGVFTSTRDKNQVTFKSRRGMDDNKVRSLATAIDGLSDAEKQELSKLLRN